jgi:hypothetical protein
MYAAITLMILGFIVIPVIVFSLIFGDGIYGAFKFLKVIGLATLWCFGLGALPIYFWGKAKRNEYAGILCISVTFGEGYALFNEFNDGMSNFIFMVFAYTIAALIVLLIVFIAVRMALEQGEKEFQTDKQDFYRLREKNDNEFTEQEERRFKYLQSHKKDFEGEFKPNKISTD